MPFHKIQDRIVFGPRKELQYGNFSRPKTFRHILLAAHFAGEYRQRVCVMLLRS
jgi:hypothetical protein